MGISNPFKLTKKVNNFLNRMSLITLDEEELQKSIEVLSDNAEKALEDAVKEQNTNKIISILGLKDIMNVNPKIKNV